MLLARGPEGSVDWTAPAAGSYLVSTEIDPAGRIAGGQPTRDDAPSYGEDGRCPPMMGTWLGTNPR